MLQMFRHRWEWKCTGASQTESNSAQKALWTLGEKKAPFSENAKRPTNIEKEAHTNIEKESRRYERDLQS